jgi:hypothetical protein
VATGIAPMDLLHPDLPPEFLDLMIEEWTDLHGSG